MSETNQNGINVPPEQDFDTANFQGSMQQVLQENIGNYVIVEFLIGTGGLDARQGFLYNVSTQFIVLYDSLNYRYTVCDIFSIKFVTFLLPGYQPGQILTDPTFTMRPSTAPSSAVPELTPAAEPNADVSRAIPQQNTTASPEPMTPGQAAFAHAVRFQSSASRQNPSRT